MLVTRINILGVLFLISSAVFSQDALLIVKYNDAAKRCLEKGIDSVAYYNEKSLDLSTKLKVPNFDGKYLQAYLLIRSKEIDKALPIVKVLLTEAKTSRKSLELGKANYLYALWYEEKDDVNNSLKYAEVALQIREKAKDTAQLLNSLSQLGRIYKKHNKLTEGLTYYLRVARLSEQSKDSLHIYSAYINLGTLYQKTADNKKAREFYYKALELNKRDNDTNGYAICYLKLSTVWSLEKNLDSASYYINKCVELHRIQNNEAGLMSSLIKLAGVLSDQHNHDGAIKNYNEVIRLAEKKNDAYWLASALTGKAKAYYKIKNYNAALPLALRVLNENKEPNDFSFMMLTHKLIADIASAKGDYRIAYEHHVLYKNNLDSLLAQNDVKKQTELKLSYEFDQIQEKQKGEALAKEIENNLRIESEKTKRYFLIGFLLLALVIVVIAIRSYITKRKSNLLLETKNIQLDSQKQLVEIKNKEINDSINYAKHIQTACLPSKEQIDACFDDYYLLFKPRDIVSGDFFWTAQTDRYTLLGIADCTGHGVPGAIMSMIGSILLNEIFIVKNIVEPEKVLQELNRVVKLTLKQEGDSKSRDGMDIAFCAWDRKAETILYSGANRPLIIITATGELKEFKPTKQPIGGSTELNQEYDLLTIKLEKGDRVVFSTDGFADQFGGENGKKINTKRFKEKLVEIRHLESKEQEKELERFFVDWKNKQEQTDDVLVFSFKA